MNSSVTIPADWESAFATVRRDQFIPARVWLGNRGGGNGYRPVDRATDPEQWQRAVESDQPIVTQMDDGYTSWPEVGYRPTCSASRPSTVAAMLHALDLREGQSVLEIGTGTGYSSALLAQRAGHVTTIEIDRELARGARVILQNHHGVRCVTGDGAQGHRDTAPYHRVISTASVNLFQLPYEWIAQTRPGGIILAPVRTDLAFGPLVRFVVGEDGTTAIGHAVDKPAGFLELRAHRTATRWPLMRWDDPDAELSRTHLDPFTVLLNEDATWAIAAVVPRVVVDVWNSADDRAPGKGIAWVVDAATGSWASLTLCGDGGDGYEVRQAGPRRLWNEVDTALRWWHHIGCPTVEQWTYTVTDARQAIHPDTTRNPR